MAGQPPTPEATRGAAPSHEAGAASTRALRALGHDFRVRTWDEGLSAHLDALLGGLADDAAGPGCLYSLVDRGPGADWRYALTRDDELLKQAHSPAPLLGRLVHNINRSAVESVGERTVLHAAAAQLGDATLVLPAAMDAGKSTLVAALVKSGFRYLTDEAVAISPDDLTFPPFAKPLGLEGVSKALHADLEPEPHPLVADWAERSWLVAPRSIREDAVGEAARPTAIVAVRYDPEAGTRLRPLGRAAAVEELARRTFGFHDAGRRHLAVLGEVVRGAACYAMTVDDLGEAVALLRDVAGDR